jgi:hypothetical protein
VRRDWDDFVTLYDFPAEHWIHLRTSNPIESLFAGVRLWTDVAKRMRRCENALYLVFKIAQRLEHSWRPLNGGLTIMTLLLGGAHLSMACTCPNRPRCRPPDRHRCQLDRWRLRQAPSALTARRAGRQKRKGPAAAGPSLPNWVI